MVTMVRPVRRKRKGTRLWWRVHQWAGLQVSLFLAFVFLTGTLAVFSYELDWMLRPAMWVSPASAERPVSWGEIGAAVAAHDPEARIVTLSAPLNGAAAVDAVVRADGEARHVYVHPGTGAVTGEGPWLGVQRFLRNTHRHLMLPVRFGVPIVSIATMLLFVSLVTSFAVYKNWWRGFLRWPRGRTLRAIVGDAHRLAGIWSIWFIIVLIVTGFWYLFEILGGNAPGVERPVPQAVETLPPADALGRALDTGIAAAQAELPGFHVEAVIWPTPKSPMFHVHGASGRAILVRPRVDSVWIDAQSGEVLAIVDPRKLSVHQRISEGADPLHFGTFGGYWTKTIWFVFGLGLTGLALSGVAVYALRIAKAGGEAPGWRKGLVAGWRGM
ncbi:MAG: hypothetical protein VR74_11585, partial [Hyphomonas sp. BRH_c22]|uniref:PepSY-associated TM helix domain-containing protein n=1 Tax=Hyphomonas sp. BRH_c22 TaxID=1629710 RepID=UPI0005F0F458